MLDFNKTWYVLIDIISSVLSKALFVLAGCFIIILSNIITLFEHNWIRKLLSNLWQIKLIILFYMFLDIALNDPISILFTVFIILPFTGDLFHLSQHLFCIDVVKSISTFTFQNYSDSRVHLNSVPIMDSIKKALDYNKIVRVLAIISLVSYCNISPFKTIFLLCESSPIFEFMFIMVSLLVIPSIIIYCFIFRIFTRDNIIQFLCIRVIVMAILLLIFPISWLLIKSYLFVEFLTVSLFHLFLDEYLYINGTEDPGTGSSKITNTGDVGSNSKGNNPGNKGNNPGNKGNNFGKNITPNDKPTFKLEYVVITKNTTTMAFLFDPNDPSGQSIKHMKRDDIDNELHDIAVNGQKAKAARYSWRPDYFAYKTDTGEYINEFGVSKSWAKEIEENYDVKEPTSFKRGAVKTGLITRVVAKETVENVACMDPESIKPYRNYMVDPEQDAFYRREHIEAQNRLGKRRTYDEHISDYNTAEGHLRGRYARAQSRYKQARIDAGELD